MRRSLDGSLSEDQAAEAEAVLRAAAANWAIVSLTTSICERAAEPFPVEPVRALDALHLATVLLVSGLDSSLVVLTTDRRIAANAGRLALRCLPG